MLYVQKVYQRLRADHEPLAAGPVPVRHYPNYCGVDRKSVV